MSNEFQVMCGFHSLVYGGIVTSEDFPLFFPTYLHAGINSALATNYDWKAGKSLSLRRCSNSVPGNLKNTF